jgi:hypothetical protein
MTMTLDEAQKAFRENPCNATAGAYLDVLMDHGNADIIDDDTWLNGIVEIRDWLTRRAGLAEPAYF